MKTLSKSGIKSSITVPLLLLVVALAFRLIDIFVLRLDELLGEIILSKSLGLLLVVGYCMVAWKSLRPIGFLREGMGRGLAVCGAITAAGLAAGYALDLLTAGGDSRLVFAAIDPKAGVAGGLLFAAWLVFGNVINVLMEEGLFRGVLLRLFGEKLPISWANFWQALLFGLWHLPWAIKAIATGQTDSTGQAVMMIALNFLPQLLMGVVWGVYVLRTGNLWGAAFSHFLVNSTLNLLHVQAMGGMDMGMSLRMSVLMTICSIGALWMARQSLSKSLSFVR